MHAIVRRGAFAGALAVLSIDAFRASAGAAPVPCLVECLVAVQIARIATRRGAESDRQIALLSFLGAALAGVLGGGPVFAVLLVAMLLVAPGALVLSHLRREVEGNYRQGARDRTGMPVDVPRILRSKRVVGREVAFALGALGLVTMLAGAIAFVLVPHVGLGLVGLRARSALLADTIDLSRRDVPDDAIVMRFTVDGLADPPPLRPLRLRGAVLDAYDGTTWTRRTSESTPYSSGARHGTRVTIDREPLDPPILFVPQGTTAIDAPVPLARTREGEVRFTPSKGRALRYDVWIAREPLPGASIDADVAPPPISERVRALAHAWADGEPTPRAKAKTIERHLREGYGYDLRSPSRGTPDALDHFLFESKRGHCELFATAMAAMLREVGVPSRVVTGFVGGTWNRFGRFYAVRESEAHAWAEALVDGTWTTFDATPSAPPRASSLDVARELGEAVARSGDGFDLSLPRLVLLIAVAVAVVLWLLSRLRPRERSIAGRPKLDSPRAACDATELYAKLESALARQGLTRDAAVPPLKYAEMLAARRHPLAPEVFALTHVYLEARFGGATLTRAERRDFEDRVRSMGAHPRT